MEPFILFVSMLSGKSVQNFDQLPMRGVSRVAELIARMCIDEPAQPQKLPHTLSPV